MIALALPGDLKKIYALPAGTMVTLSGEVLTMRDKAHAHIIELLNSKKEIPVTLRNAVVYYCGPTEGMEGFPAGSCGPTTSKRMDPYTPLLLASGVRVMIGKGKRSEMVIEAIKKYGAVYLVTLGGLGAYLSARITKCSPVAYKEWGPEAIYKMCIQDFPALVAVDAKGRSIY